MYKLKKEKKNQENIERSPWVYFKKVIDSFGSSFLTFSFDAVFSREYVLI